MKDFIVKETAGFRLRVTQKRCLRPEDLYSLDFVQEVKNDDGEVVTSSTYNFFLTDSEIETLVQGLKA
jgi:hypothetical protein